MTDTNITNSEISPHISTAVDTFVPEHIRSNYPQLVEFISAYLDFLETENLSSYYQNTLPYQRDIRLQQEQFLKRIENEIGLYVPVQYKADPKVFYDHISDLWKSKGSEECIKTFFRLFFDEPVQISYPSDNVLIPSHSRWEQESFITLEYEGGLDSDASSIRVYRSSRDIESLVSVNRVEEIHSTSFRIYSNTELFENVEIGDKFSVYDLDTFLFYAFVVPSPNGLSVRNPGKNWKPGQVLVFPGTDKDTLIRIDAVDSNGGIRLYSVIQYGFQHASSPTLIVSPYAYKPVGSGYDITIDPLSSGGVSYTLELTGDSASTSDLAIGSTAPGTYFIEDYVDPTYTGSTAFSVSTQSAETGSDTTIIYSPTDLTLQEWLDSRATVTLEYGPRSTLQGEWKDLSSILSNDFSRIQDSYYYQTFSYEISGDINPTDYESIVPEFNPAGHKPFFNYAQSVNFNTFVVDVDFTLPFIEIDFTDSVTGTDSEPKSVVKKLVDVGTVLEQIQNNLYKPLSDSVSVSDTPVIQAEKRFTDSITAGDDVLGSDFVKNFGGDYFSEGYTEAADFYTVTVTRTDVDDSAEILLNGTLEQVA